MPQRAARRYLDLTAEQVKNADELLIVARASNSTRSGSESLNCTCMFTVLQEYLLVLVGSEYSVLVGSGYSVPAAGNS